VGQPLSLDLHPFESIVLLVCVIGSAIIIKDGAPRDPNLPSSSSTHCST
jgi:hypothetical protein